MYNMYYIKQKSCGGDHYGFTIHMHKKQAFEKGHPRYISAKFSFKWFSSFRGG